MSDATRRPRRGDLGRLVADRPEDRRVLVVDPAHAAEVDELDLVADLDEVVGLEVAVDEPEVVEVLERRQDLEDVGEGLVGGDRVVAAGLAHPLLEDGLQRGAADVLHDDVAGVVVGDEVVDLDDVRVRDLGEEPLLGDRRGQRVGVAGVEQALEDDPAVRHVLVAGEVDPAEAAVGEAAGHLVLPGDEVAGLELGVEGERLAALGAEAGRAARVAVLAAPDRVRRSWSRTACPPGPTGSFMQRLAGVDRGSRAGSSSGRAPSRAAAAAATPSAPGGSWCCPGRRLARSPRAAEASGCWPATSSTASSTHRRARWLPAARSRRRRRRCRSSRRGSCPLQPGCAQRRAVGDGSR